jgi:hypothetical protein
MRVWPQPPAYGLSVNISLSLSRWERVVISVWKRARREKLEAFYRRDTTEKRSNAPPLGFQNDHAVNFIFIGV